MALCVRLDPALDAELELHCKREGVTKTRIVTRALQDYLESKAPSSYELLEEVLATLPAATGGPTNDSIHYKKRLKEKLRAKYSR